MDVKGAINPFIEPKSKAQIAAEEMKAANTKFLRDHGKGPQSGSIAVVAIQAIAKKARADKIRRNNLQPTELAAELTTGCSGHAFGSAACKQSSAKGLPLAPDGSESRRSTSISSSSCLDEGSTSSDNASDQQTNGKWGEADAVPLRYRLGQVPKEAPKGINVTEPPPSGKKGIPKGSLAARILNQSGSNHAKSSSYRMEIEYLPSSATHASFGFDNANNVILTQFSEKIKDGIRTILVKGWEQGIKKEGTCHDKERYFFKLKRKPFTSGNVYALTRIARNIIAYLAFESWMAQPVASLLSPYDTLNFRKCPKPPPSCYWLAMSYGYAGKWHLRDQLSILGGANELIDTIRLTLQEMDLISKLKKERVAGADNWHQFYLKGAFHRTGSWARKKILFLRIMERLEERGWVLYVAYHRIYHESTEYERKVGTWICVKSREWTPTKPVKFSWTD